MRTQVVALRSVSCGQGRQRPCTYGCSLEIVDNDVPDHAEVLVELLSPTHSTFILIFLAAQTMLLVEEIVMQRIISIAFGHVAGQLVTLSHLHFTFQRKNIGKLRTE